MQLGIDTLQIRQSHLFLQDHLVEADNEISVKESSVENSETQASPNKLEVVQVFRVDTGGWVDLQGIIVVCRILEETVEWVEHFVGQQEEKFSVKNRLKHWRVEC